jgi:uncharacterized membrane protein YdbT with pleckstrin-like domain
VLKRLYTLAFLLIAIVYGYNNNRAERMDWLIVFPIGFLIWVAFQHFRVRSTRMSIDGVQVRFESGFPARVTRNMELSKVQDVRVQQSFYQRFFGIGDISIESAGETGSLTMRNVDDPQIVADIILQSART